MDMCVLLTSTPFCLVSPRGDHEGAAFVIARRGDTTIIEINNRHCTVYLSGVAFKERLIMCTNFKTVRSLTRTHMHAKIFRSQLASTVAFLFIYGVCLVYILYCRLNRGLYVSLPGMCYVLNVIHMLFLYFLFAFEQSITCIISQSERHLYICITMCFQVLRNKW